MRKKCTVQENKRQEEVDLAERFIHHTTENLRKPKIDSGKDTHHRSSKENVVDMRYDEIGIVEWDVN